MDNRDSFRSDGFVISINTLSSADEGMVRNLFTKQSMKFAGFGLCYDRGFKFKSLLRLQAPFFQTYVAKKDNHLLSVISVSSGPRWISRDGHRLQEELAVVSDFRIDGSRHSRKHWRDWLGEVFDLYRSEFPNHSPNYFLAFVLKGNRTALNSFIAGHRYKPFELKEVGSVRMVNVFAHWKKLKIAPGYRVESLQPQMKGELIQFIKDNEQKKQAGYVVDTEGYCELQRRMNEWHLSWDQFIIVRNAQDKIVSCTLPWSAPTKFKKMYFNQAPRVLSWLLKGLHRFGFSVPKEGEPIKTLYLTHLNIDDQESADILIASILSYVFSNKLNRGYQMVSFPDWWNMSKSTLVFRNTFHQMTDVGIYSITMGKGLKLNPNEIKIFGFEMAVI